MKLIVPICVLICSVHCLGQSLVERGQQEKQIEQLLDSLSRVKQPENIAFKDVNLISMTDSIIKEHQTVMVRDGKITDILPFAEGLRIGDIKVIDGSGLYLMPGLTDSHFHFFWYNERNSHSYLLLLLANGVTSVRDMNGTELWLKERDKIRLNRLLGPNMYMCGPAIAVKAGKTFTAARNPMEGRAKVREHISKGFDFIKVYDGLSKETFDAIVEEAKNSNAKVFGHVPRSISLSQALRDMNSTEHHTGFFLYPENILADKDYLNLVKDSKAWICPTMTTSLFNMQASIVDDTISYPEMRYISPYLKKRWASEPLPGGINRENFKKLENQEFLPNLVRAKAKFLAGTDAGALKNMVPGFTLIREVKKMTGIGLSNYEALKTATINPAIAMGKESEIGTIQLEKRADLLLLSKNPLENIDNINSRKGVMVRGIWLSDVDLKFILDRIQRVYNRN